MSASDPRKVDEGGGNSASAKLELAPLAKFELRLAADALVTLFMLVELTAENDAQKAFGFMKEAQNHKNQRRKKRLSPFAIGAFSFVGLGTIIMLLVCIFCPGRKRSGDGDNNNAAAQGL